MRKYKKSIRKQRKTIRKNQSFNLNQIIKISDSGIYEQKRNEQKAKIVNYLI